MSQANGTGPAQGTGAATGTASAQGAAPTGPAQTTNPAQTGTAGVQEDFVRMPRELLQPWNGDHHEVIRQAKLLKDFEARMGMPIEQIVREWEAQVNGTVTQQPPQAATPPPQQTQMAQTPGLTTKDIEELLEKRDAANETKRQQEQTAARLAQAEREVQTAWATGRKEALDAVGVKPDEKGAMPPFSRAIEAAFDRELIAATIEAMPEFDRNNPEAVNNALRFGTPNKAVVAKATKAVKDFVTDLRTSSIANFAEAQSTTPAQTLAGGQGGGAPNLDLRDPAQRRQFLKQTAAQALQRRQR